MRKRCCNTSRVLHRRAVRSKGGRGEKSSYFTVWHRDIFEKGPTTLHVLCLLDAAENWSKVELDSLLFSGPKIDMWLADWILEEWFVRWEAKVTEFEALFYLMMLNVRNDFDWVKLDDILSTGAGASSHTIDKASRRHTITRHLQVHKELNAVQK